MPATSPKIFEISTRIGKTQVEFLIDTGAAVSLFPVSMVKNIHNLRKSSIQLTAANGTKIPSFGELDITLSIRALRRNYSWNFIIADISKPILGLDFLAHHKLVLDCSKRKLSDSVTNRLFFIKTSCTYDPSINAVKYSEFNFAPKISHLLNKYESLSRPDLPGTTKEIPGNIFHRIETGNAYPTYARTRQLPEDKLKAAKDEFSFLLKNGIIRPSSSPWSSPLHMVPKKNPGEWRACGDFRALNSLSKPDKYPLPHIRSISQKLSKMQVFSKIDLVRAYHQIPVFPDDVEKTAITTPFGLYEYVRMPFGLKNAGATFQRKMDSIFNPLDNTFCYLDDILIFSQNIEDHLLHLEQVFNVLSKHRFKINIDKCQFAVHEIEFLGFLITPNGLSIPPRKIEAIDNITPPKDTKELRRFLGMCGFYRHLCPNFADTTAALSERMKNLQRKNEKIILTDSELSAFTATKKLLNEVIALHYPSPESTLYHLVTDASNVAIGAALHQIIDGKPVPISFFSRKLTEVQRKYSAFDRELLAAYSATLYFKHTIEGRSATLFTDHKPLVSAFFSKNPAKSDRQQRHLAILTEFLADAQHISGSDNVVADTLSRSIYATASNSITESPIDLPAIADAQEDDVEIKEYNKRLTKTPLSKYKFILCDHSTNYPRPFIPEKLRFLIFTKIHGLSHPGPRASKRLIKARYFWPFMDKEISKWAKECLSCQQNKIARHTKTSKIPMEIPCSRFETVHLDIVGPLPPAIPPGSDDITPYRYLLTCMDRATCWKKSSL